MAGESMLAGLLRGMVDKKKNAEAREQQKEMFSLEKANKQLQQTMLKLKSQQLQVEKAREDRLWAEIERRRAERGGSSGQGDASTGQKEPTQFGDSFKQGGGITDQLAGYGLDIGPDEAALMGGKFQDIYENNYKERDFNRKLGQDQYKRMKDAQEVDRIPIETPQGTFLQTLPKNPGLAGQPQGMMQTGPPPIKMETRSDPDSGMKYQVPVNEITGQEMGQRTPVEPLKGESAEASAKIALANQGLKHTEAVTNAFIKPDGTVNRELVMLANAPMGGIGAGRQVRATFLDALDARARAATGAAMPDSEVANYTRMYFPSPLDDDKTIKDKLKRLNGFLRDYMNALDPSGLQRKRLNKKADFVYDPATGKLVPAK